MIVWWYLGNTEKRYKTYVANRVSLIREATDSHQWRHVDTASNPADDVSRGFTAAQLFNSDQWINGPAFLWQPD